MRVLFPITVDYRDSVQLGKQSFNSTRSLKEGRKEGNIVCLGEMLYSISAS